MWPVLAFEWAVAALGALNGVVRMQQAFLETFHSLAQIAHTPTDGSGPSLARLCQTCCAHSA